MFPVPATKVKPGEFLKIKHYKGEVPSVKRKINGKTEVVYEGPINVKVLKITQHTGKVNKGKKTGTGNLLLVKELDYGQIRSYYVEHTDWKFMGPFRTAWYKLKEMWSG